MTITIAPELEAKVREKAMAEGVSVEQYVATLIEEDHPATEISEPALQADDPEFEQIRAAIMEGLEQAQRGESRPAEQVFSELRARHDLSR